MATPGRKLDDGTRKSMFRLLRQGMSRSKIARILQVSRTTVWKHLKHPDRIAVSVLT